MKYILLTLVILFSARLFAELPSVECYQFNKNNFQSHINIENFDDENVFMIIRGYGIAPSDSPQVSIVYDVDQDLRGFSNCTIKQKGHFDCQSTNTSSLSFSFRDNTMLLEIDQVELSQNFHGDSRYILNAKGENPIQGKKVTCEQPIKTKIYAKIKKGSIEEKVLKSIDINNIVVKDFKMFENKMIVLGEYDSLEEREKGLLEEHYFPLVVLLTNDRGKHWKKIVNFEQHAPLSFFEVIDSEHMIIGMSNEGAGGYIITSIDGGKNWKTTYEGSLLNGFKPVQIDRNETIKVYTITSILYSKDYGLTWRETPLVKSSE
ncbi:WD40/YVTN/BNR-like repeat-containing protein [Sulfurovum mangrovi]|uniref:WD40/YVTN/BNR-like repeat-containing protein n=1 Tax=Sulfurovum mangrovi TaxID=2893889 RepID=UPI001E3B251C|nr:hypothetical protein [Sulfurovum mangrovi]UFH58126.1 hypothetical protein LN246_07155 [Sulfurovum mangrovi]